MGNKDRFFFHFVIILASVFLYGCSSASVYLVNLNFVKDAIINYHESGNFHKDTEQVVNEAIDKFNKINPGEKSAVIFDVDETALSNYEFNKEWDFGYVEKYFDMWVDSAKAPAISEVQKLYDYLIERNFRIVFITGRKADQYDATYKNLKAAGYTVFDTVIVKDNGYDIRTALKFKSDKRIELTQKKYTIVGTVGDQRSDLEGPYHGIQVKIPNYQYYIY
jgi:predicted secreted acid phosphatase